MLTGQAKTDYQREYMRKRRSNKVHLCPAVRPGLLDPNRKEVLDPPVRPVLSVREELEQTPLAELEKKGGWIPNWRKVQG